MSREVHEMFTAIAPRYDRANEVLSFGMHRRWRRRAAELAAPRPGDRVLDCATGTGDLAREFLARVLPGGEVVGTDFNEAMLSFAVAKGVQPGLRFEQADATALPYPDNSFDIASIAFGIRNVDDPRLCLRELARVVRPGGRVLIVEFGQPQGLFGYAYRFYARNVIPRLGAWTTGKSEPYRYLPETAAKFPSGPAFTKLMDETHVYENIRAEALTGGVTYAYLGTVT